MGFPADTYQLIERFDGYDGKKDHFSFWLYNKKPANKLTGFIWFVESANIILQIFLLLLERQEIVLPLLLQLLHLHHLQLQHHLSLHF